jgi:Regulator of Chromosome Condensation (RCC1) repeat protein
MRIMRRVLAILVVLATLFLVGQPAQARAEECTGDCRARLVQVGLQGRVVQLVADGDSTCALTDAGDVYCWGADYPDEYRPGRNPMLLVTVGALLIAGGATLLMLSRWSPRERRRETAPPPA